MIRKPNGPYERFIKRFFDIFLCSMALICFCWLYAIVAIIIRIKLGSPVLFSQERPGKGEKIFKLYKFRSMTDERDAEGNLLLDDVRLTNFGKFLRSTSLEDNDIIRQTTKSLENKGFLEVSLIHFYQGCNLISNELNTVVA